MRYVFNVALICLSVLLYQIGYAGWMQLPGPGSGAVESDGEGLCSGSELICEDFSGTGAPTDWTAEQSGIDYDATTSPPSGVTEYLEFLSSSASHVIVTFSGGAEAYISFIIKVPTLANFTDMVSVGTSSSAYDLGYLRHTSGGNLTIYGNGTTDTTSSGSAITADTWLYVRMYINTGTSSDGEMRVYTSSDGSSYTEILTITDGTNNSVSVGQLRFKQGMTMHVSNVRVSETGF